MIELTLADLQRFAPGARPTILAGIVEQPELLDKFGISAKPLRLCHFLAQTGKESDGFRTTTEYASGIDYEGRADLGNVCAGDGRCFRGRGLIQCTGRANYRAFTKWMKSSYPNAPDFEVEPEKLALFPWALDSAVWYWDTHDLNRIADTNNLRAVTRTINGGLNGLADRQAYFKRAWAIWGASA